jgi:hypothetical protein
VGYHKHAACAVDANGDRSSSSASSFGGMPSRNSLKKNSGNRSIKPTDTGSGTARDKDHSSKNKRQESSNQYSSSILSSPFLDSFQEQVHEIVSEYRSEVRNTFQELAHDMLYHRDRKIRQEQQVQERRETKASGSASADEDEIEKESVVDDEQGVSGDNVNADWDDEMDAPLSLFVPETIDSEPPFEQERFDVFSDLAGDGTTNDEADDNLVVGDTDEEDDSVLGRLPAQSGLSQETSQGRPDGNVDETAVEPLDSELVHSVVEKTTKKKKKKKKRKKSNKGKKVAEILEASNSNEDKLPVQVPSSGVSDLVASPVDNKSVAQVLRSMTSTVFFVIMYVLTALLIKALTNVLKR